MDPHECASALELRRAAVLNSQAMTPLAASSKMSETAKEGEGERGDRPRPHFFADAVTFSTKKEKSSGTPRCMVAPPRPPIKSCPPVSRLRPSARKPEDEGARVVSFVNNDLNNSLIRAKNSSDNEESNFGNLGSDRIARKDLYFEQSFVIEAYLGSGSFGKVYKVKSKEDGKYYAVKKSKEKFKGTSDRKRKLEEVAKHEELPQHPNFVKFYRAWEEKQKLYIQIELCQMSLSVYATTNHDIPEDTIWKFLIDLLRAVKHLHDRNLVHMDIKPDNIFVSFDGVCKLGDFGLVIDLKKDDLKEIQEGDPKYLAPEVLKDIFSDSCLTPAVDIFSLGLSILELATDLELPRGGELWHTLRNGQIPADLTASLSTQLVQIIHSMIDPNYKRRATADFLLADVDVKRRMVLQKRQEFFKKMVEKLKKAMGFFYTLVSRDLVAGCRLLAGGFGLISWLSRRKDRLVGEWSRKGSAFSDDLDGDLSSIPIPSNSTPTPNKADPDANANTNLLEINDINNEEQDDDECCEVKMRKYLKKVRKYDQYDYKLLNLMNTDEPSLLYDSCDDSSSSSDFSDSNNSRSNKSSGRYKAGIERKCATATKLEFSPTSISPANGGGGKLAWPKRYATDIKASSCAFQAANDGAPGITTIAGNDLLLRRSSSKGFTRQKLNFDEN